MKTKRFQWIKNIARTMFSVALFAMAAGVFAACSSDDDGDKNGGGDDNQSGTTTGGGNTGGTAGNLAESGFLLSRFGDANFYYDSKNRLIKVSHNYSDYENIEINYSKGTIETEDYDNLSFTLNKKGYITSIKASWEDDYDDDYDKGSGTISIGYDNNGHMTSYKATSSGKGVEYGEKYTYSTTLTTTFTWKNGLLTKYVENYTEKEDGEKDTWKDIFEFEYGDTPNKFGQYTELLVGSLDLLDGELDYLAYAGMFGKASSMLPESVENTYIDDEEDGHETYYASYTLNSNGTIKSERQGYTTYNYYYTDIKNGKEVVGQELAEKFSKVTAKPMRKHIFKRHRNRK